MFAALSHLFCDSCGVMSSSDQTLSTNSPETQMKPVTLLAALWQFYTDSDELHTLPLTARTQPEPWFEYWGVYRSSIQIQPHSLMNTKRPFNVLFDRLPALAVHVRAMAWWNDRTVSSVEMKVSSEEKERKRNRLSYFVVVAVFLIFFLSWLGGHNNKNIIFPKFWAKDYIFLHQICLTKQKGCSCF